MSNTKFKTFQKVEIIRAIGCQGEKNGDTAIVDELASHNGVWARLDKTGSLIHFCDSQIKLIGFKNREFLSDFLKLNNIKKTLVSLYIGYSENWLTQMSNDKRRDMTDETLKNIMKKLHIDWSQDTFINVKKTKYHTAYRTKPITYKTDMHKESLQRAMWDGEFIR